MTRTSAISTIVSEVCNFLGWTSAPEEIYKALLITSNNASDLKEKITKYHNFIDENSDEEGLNVFVHMVFYKLKTEWNVENPSELF